MHVNPVYEELKAKAKVNLWSESNAQIYARRKIEVESVFGHIKGNRSFRRFSLRGLTKVQTEFGIVAMAHNLLKVAGLRQLLSIKHYKNKKTGGEKRFIFLHLFYFRDLLDSPFSLTKSLITYSLGYSSFFKRYFKHDLRALLYYELVFLSVKQGSL